MNEDGSSEIGYGIVDEYQGEGYATEAVTELDKWALYQPGVSRITAEAEESNLASIRVLEKAGFIPTGKRSEEQIEKSAQNSSCFGVVVDKKLVGFARVFRIERYLDYP